MDTTSPDSNTLLNKLVEGLTQKLGLDSDVLVKKLVEQLVKGPFKSAKQDSKKETQTAGPLLVEFHNTAKMPKFLEKAFADLNKTLQNTLEGKEKQTVTQTTGPLLAEFLDTAKMPKFLEKVFVGLNKTLQNTFGGKEKQTAEAPKSLLEQTVAGVTISKFEPEAVKQLTESMGSVFPKDMLKNLGKDKEPKQEKPTGSGGGFRGALGVLGGLFGLFLAIDSISTTEWYKGLEKMLGRGLLKISGVSGMFNKIFSKVLGTAVKGLGRIVGGVAKGFKSLLGGGKAAAGVAAKTGLSAGKGIIGKMFGGLLKFVTKIPVIGAIISIGSAWSRFKTGDIVGGFIDILSGIASCFPGIGTGISFGLDALNAFLDYKAGGSDVNGGKAKSKGSIIGEWLSGIGDDLWNKAKKWPVVGPLIKAYEAFKQGEWFKGIKQMVYAVPAFEALGAFFGDEEAVTSPAGEAGAAGKSVIAELRDAAIAKAKETGQKILDDALYIIKNPLKSLENAATGAMSTVAGWLGFDGPKETPVGDGVIGTDGEGARISTKGGLFKTNPDDSLLVAPFDKVITPNDSSFADILSQLKPDEESKKHSSFLSDIGHNTSKTNGVLSDLVAGFNMLARNLKDYAEKTAGKGSVVVAGNNQPAPRFSSTEIAKAGNPVIDSYRRYAESARPIPV